MSGETSEPAFLEVHTVQSVLPGNVDRIFVNASISPFVPEDMNNTAGIAAKSTARHLGIFDTGASRTVISEKLAGALNLAPVGKQTVYTANGPAIQNRHIINLCLPNSVILPRRIVTAARLHDIDFLLGMDVIRLGDFSITAHYGFKLMRFEIFTTASRPPVARPHLRAYPSRPRALIFRPTANLLR